MSNSNFIIKNKPNLKNVNHIIIYALPKVGKTTAVSMIPKNVILAFEDQAFYCEGDMIDMRANTEETIKEKLKQLPDIINEIKSANYNFVTIDTLSSMIPYAKYLGELLYSKTVIGKNWFTKGKADYGDLLNIPKGLGYEYLKQGVTKFYDLLFSNNLKVITVAHVKEKYMDDSGTISMLDIDAPGPVSRMLAKEAQIIGYLSKRKTDEVWISFKNTENILTGTIVPDLQGKDFILTKKKDDKFESNWEEILKYIL